MEPDITALSSTPVVESGGPVSEAAERSERLLVPRGAESPSPMASLLSGVTVSTPEATNGHTNGHGVAHGNGHANGNGHGNGNGHTNGHALASHGLDLMPAGAGAVAASWTALAGPVRSAVVTGGYAASDRQAATARE